MHTSLSVWKSHIISIASKRNLDFTDLAADRWLIIVGRDTTAVAWQYSRGAFVWTTWLVTTSGDMKYKYLDDTMGPFNDGSGFPTFYFLFRNWVDPTNFVN